MPLFKEINTFVYFEFVHGQIQHVNILDEKTLLDHFNGWDGGKNMEKYE